MNRIFKNLSNVGQLMTIIFQHLNTPTHDPTETDLYTLQIFLPQVIIGIVNSTNEP